MGIATALILAALINLGIKAFYPEPKQPESYYSGPEKIMPAELENCGKDIDCLNKKNAFYDEQAKLRAENERVWNEFNQAMKVYNRDFFVIANIVGIIVFIIAFWLLMGATVSTQAALIGFMLASLWTIFFGYMRGWDSVDDRLKFVVGLAVAAMVVGGSVFLMQRHYERKGGEEKL